MTEEKLSYKLKKHNHLSIITSNRELLFPKLNEIAIYGDRTRSCPKIFLVLTNKLVEITEELEQTLALAGLKQNYLFMNGQEFRTKDYNLGSLLTIIWKYCEPIEAESIAEIYTELDEIEFWLKEKWANLLNVVKGE